MDAGRPGPRLLMLLGVALHSAVDGNRLILMITTLICRPTLCQTIISYIRLHTATSTNIIRSFHFIKTVQIATAKLFVPCALAKYKSRNQRDQIKKINDYFNLHKCQNGSSKIACSGTILIQHQLSRFSNSIGDLEWSDNCTVRCDDTSY